MQLTPTDQFAAAAALVAVLMCGGTQIRTQVLGLVLQACFLVAVCVDLALTEKSSHLLLLALAMVLIKVLGIPAYLNRAAQQMSLVRDPGAGMHPSLALLFGCGLLVLGFAISPQLAVTAMSHLLSAGMAVTMLFIGMFLMINRKLAVSQIIGFLTLENGISLYGLTQARSMPLLLEMGIVFEVLVGVLLAVLVVFRINRFEHVDAAQLRELRH